MSGLRRACEASWAASKRASGPHGYLTITVSSACGWMLERAKASGRDPIDEVAEVATGDFAGSDFWNRVRSMLNAIAAEEAPSVKKASARLAAEERWGRQKR